MKRILIAITVPLVFFSTTVFNVQGNDIDIVFGGLLVNLKNHADEIKLIEKDFLNIAQETSNLTQHEILLNIHDCLHETNENYNDLINLLFTTIYVDKKDLMLFKEYCGLCIGIRNAFGATPLGQVNDPLGGQRIARGRFTLP